MSDLVRQPPGPGWADPNGAARRGRSPAEDPLEELARILGESAHPVRPENVVEVGRRVRPAGAGPQQVSDLEAELFEQLRSSVAPEDRVRGDFVRETPPVMAQHPVDDHEIAAIGAWDDEAEPARQPAGDQRQPGDPRWDEYYAYDDGISAGSWDPAFQHDAADAVDLDAAFAAEIRRNRGAAARQPTFEGFDQAAISQAAGEAAPHADSGVAIMPHSAREEYEAQFLPREGRRSGFRVAAAVVGVLLVGGGAVAAWKSTGGGGGGGQPVVIQSDGKPYKVLPDPTRAAPTDDEVTLQRDNAVAGSKIVSLQEDPVEHVAGRSADGREVRVINPGAPRSVSPDQPRSVKTVVVRPDGSVVSGDGTTPAPEPQTSSRPPIGDTGPVVSAMPPTAPPIPEQAPVAVPVAPKPVPQIAVAPPAPVKPVAVAPVPTLPQPVVKPTPAPIRTVAPVPVAPAAPAAPKPIAQKPLPPPTTGPGGAPMALGPTAPRLASAQPEAPRPAPTPVPIAPVASSGGGEWMVQVSATKSDADARKSFSDAQRRYSALAGKSVDVQRADLGEKGVYYRARVAAGSKEAASALCAQIQSQGGQCMVTHR